MHRLYVFEKKLLRRIFGFKQEKNCSMLEKNTLGGVSQFMRDGQMKDDTDGETSKQGVDLKTV